MLRRTTLNLDLDRVADARDVLGTSTTTDTVHRALREVVRQERLRRLTQQRFELTPQEWGPSRVARRRDLIALADQAPGP
jgi:Arc/MetJ family transcription regulator